MSDYLKGRHVVGPVLTSIVRGYKNIAFIGECIFPIVLTDKEGAHVLAFGKTTLVEYDTERAAETDNNVLVHGKTGTLGLVLGGYDLAAPVNYREQAEFMFNEENKAIRRATSGANLYRELIAAHLAQDEKVYRIGHVRRLTTGDYWAGDRGDPIGVIEADAEAARAATGLRPNLMTTGVGVMALLKFHPVIQAAVGANERKRITAEILQDLFQIEEIVIGTPVSLPSMKATVDKNSVPADIWGDNLTLHYVDKPQPGTDSTDENEPSFGYALRRKEISIADRYGRAGGRAKYCRYTGIYKVTMVGGDVEYLAIGISK